ncbi:hypothetical protein ACGFT2_33725 [Streptomyces sp. NPDC048514]|uniref:hypothetical protein n=1 Tax=Streptomyces sp. NPDC048514 TaxID=3365564 RepID=UPI0037223CDD
MITSGAFPVPLLLWVTAAALLLMKRRRAPGRRPAPRLVTLSAFAVGALWARSQVPSPIDMVVEGTCAALLAGFAHAAYRSQKPLGG